MVMTAIPPSLSVRTASAIGLLSHHHGPPTGAGPCLLGAHAAAPHGATYLLAGRPGFLLAGWWPGGSLRCAGTSGRGIVGYTAKSPVSPGTEAGASLAKEKPMIKPLTRLETLKRPRLMLALPAAAPVAALLAACGSSGSATSS